MSIIVNSNNYNSILQNDVNPTVASISSLSSNTTGINVTSTEAFAVGTQVFKKSNPVKANYISTNISTFKTKSPDISSVPVQINDENQVSPTALNNVTSIMQQYAKEYNFDQNQKYYQFGVKNKNTGDFYLYSGTNNYINNLNSSFTHRVLDDPADFNRELDNEIQVANSNAYTSYYENAFKIPQDALSYVSKNYKFIYDNKAQLVTDYGLPEKLANGNDNDKKNPQMQVEIISLPIVPSMFNPWFGINVCGITNNQPLFNTSYISKVKLDTQYYADYNSNIGTDISDCSIKKLVELSKNPKANRLGRSIYKYADFMYCKDLGKYSNNRLVTLRRFALPIGDNIWRLAKPNDIDSNGGEIDSAIVTPELGRLVTWLNNENKLEDILKFNYKEGFEQREGEYQDVNSQEEDESRGIVGSIVNLANPTYRKMIGSGFAGTGNKILSAMTRNTEYLDTRAVYEGSSILTRYDRNRIYEPKGTIRDTHLYTGKLTFTQSFSLVFDYELRAYENINPKTALLDLLNNIQRVTYRPGHFWGGQVWWIGAPVNKKGWQTAEAFIDNSFDKLSDTFEMIMRGDMNLGDMLGTMANKLIGAGTKAIQTTINTLNTSEGRTKLLEKAKEYDVGNVLKGLLKNHLGRPALYTPNSILTGDPVGLWHLTIGNPRNPIMAMGNLIIEDSTVQQYGPLGIDDFPIGLKVTVTLKHAKSRDMVEIGKMYTMGQSGLGVPLGSTYLDSLIKSFDSNNFNMNASMIATAMASSTSVLTNGIVDESIKYDETNK